MNILRKFVYYPFIFFFPIFVSSCSCFKKNVSSSCDRIMLTEANLIQLDGSYQRYSEQQKYEGSLQGDLYWNLFSGLFLHMLSLTPEKLIGGDSIFVELKVIDKNKILVSHKNKNDTFTSKIMRGKIKDGYFEFRRKYLFIPMVIVNLYRTSKFRIGLSKDYCLITDFKQLTMGTTYLIIPFSEKTKENDIIFKNVAEQIPPQNQKKMFEYLDKCR